MFVPMQADGIISQFEGYDALGELDWEYYRVRYGNIQRLDLILESENDSPNHYKVSKQPDVLMFFYLFSADELRDLFARLGYPFERETIPRNVAYYAARSSHGSTLQSCGAFMGAGALRSSPLDAVFRRSVAERCKRYPAWHYCRRHPPRRDGRNGRSGAARGNRYRCDGRCHSGSTRNCRRRSIASA